MKYGWKRRRRRRKRREGEKGGDERTRADLHILTRPYLAIDRIKACNDRYVDAKYRSTHDRGVKHDYLCLQGQVRGRPFCLILLEQ